MKFIRRIGLFLILNICVVLTLSVLINLLGIKPYLTKHGLDVGSLLAFCFIWGMGGAFISLLLSKMMAKMLMHIQILNEHPSNPQYRELVSMVRRLSDKAGLKKMPEVGIYESHELNAFATGPSERSSLVAVSSGLLNRMDKDELEGVLAHEISHIKNGDMVTMTLLQGVVNAFVMFLARILAFALSSRGKSNDSRSVSGSYFLWVMLFEVVFMVLGSMVVAAFSRFREFRADKGGAQLAGTPRMIAALERLKNETAFARAQNEETKQAPAYAYLKISSGRPGGLTRLFASHPPLEERIDRLRKAR